MKSVTKKTKLSQKPPLAKHDSFNQVASFQEKKPLTPDENRRYTQLPSQQFNPSQQKANRCSRVTNFKSQYGPSRKRSTTPKSRASEQYIVECQSRYKQLEQVVKKQNENLLSQNQFLKQQIRNLYQRQSKYKQTIKRYKQQIEFLKLQNQVYQQRYTEIKNYVNTVIERMNAFAQEQAYFGNGELLRNSSMEIVNQFAQEFSQYCEKEKEDEQKLYNYGKEINVQKRKDSKNDMLEILQTQQQHEDDITNKVYSMGNDDKENADLQQTRFIKEPKFAYTMDSFALRKAQVHETPSPIYASRPFPPHPHNHQTPMTSSQPSNQNSDCKTVDVCPQNNKLLQDTSQSNGITPHQIDKKISDLTDQSQALLYQLNKSGNKNQQIKKQIIRISQKIRELKLQKDSDTQRFTSLQNIMQKS